MDISAVKHTQEPRNPCPSDRPAAARTKQPSPLPLGMALFALIAPLAAALVEMKQYAPILEIQGPWQWQNYPLVWLLYAKSLQILLPILLIALLLARLAWRKSGAMFLTGGSTLLLFWLLIDLRTQALTGVHALAYLQFIGGPDAPSWAGDFHMLLIDAGSQLLRSLAAVLCALAVCTLAVLLLLRFLPRIACARTWALLAGLHLLGLLGAAPAQILYHDMPRLQMLHDTLPISAAWLAPSFLPDTRQFRDDFLHRVRPTVQHAHQALFSGLPVDSQARIDSAAPPNVIVLILESLRYTALTPEMMPRLSALADRGLRLDRHYSGGNMTHMGLFSLLYARPAGLYWATLQRRIPPQACITFRNSGFQATYLAGVDHRGWGWMERFINDDGAFDEMRLLLDGDWPTTDRLVLQSAREMLSRPGERPQFIMAFLASTHFPYVYPPEFEMHRPVCDVANTSVLMMHPSQREGLLNRYRNAAAFLDHEVSSLIESLDPQKNIILLTGDHGESIWDDGRLSHGGPLSEIRTRVPCFIIGPGIAPQTITAPTAHADLLPTLLHAAAGKAVPLRHATGQDILADDFSSRYTLVSPEHTRQMIRLVLVRPDQKLMLKIDRARPTIEVEGTLDAAGRLHRFILPAPEDAKELADEFNHVLHRLLQ